ncbi:MAG: T9SS type A sorting domain-containing protein [Ignavibacteriaceae bacterium]
MWYTGGGGEFGKIGYAYSIDGKTWQKDSTNNPVLTPGDPGSWDDQGINSPEVLFIDGVFHMWFGGFDGSQAQIGHATSLNGIDWEKDTLPVLQVGMAGSWDNASVSQPSVLFDGKMFHMWYGGGTDFNWKIGYAKSIDGKTWQRDDKNNPVLEPGLSVQWVGYQTVCFNSDSTFFDMWYTAGVSAGFVSDIGYATAPFVPVPRNPIQNSGFESWIGDTPEGWETSNQVGIQNVLPSTDAHSGNFSARMEIVEWQGIPFAPQLFTDDGGFGFQISERYNMLTGYYKLIPQEGDFLDVSVIMLSDGQWLIGSGTATYSEAADTWTQFSIPINYLGTENPVYCSIQVNVGFSQNVGGIAFIDDLELSVISDIESSTADEIPDNFELSQNYPNPFNPSTTLKYSVPKFSNVVIKVFDILGNEIQTLVNKEKATGTYELTWYAEGFPSGVYFYRLQAGDFVETKKMILMK